MTKKKRFYIEKKVRNRKLCYHIMTLALTYVLGLGIILFRIHYLYWLLFLYVILAFYYTINYMEKSEKMGMYEPKIKKIYVMEEEVK